MKKYRKQILAAVALACVMLFGAESCDGETDPAPDSDSSQSFADGSKVPVDSAVYTITGEVVGPVNDVTRQVEPAQGSTTIAGSQYGIYGSGTFTGPIEAGKGFVRLRVTESSPATDLAPTGDVTIIKTSDTKVKALLTGDVVAFKCRRQYENLAAVKDNEKFDADKLATYELDYCRLASPVITVKPAG